MALIHHSIIDFSVLKRFGLSVNEYLYLDIINKLSKSTKSGDCTASNKEIAATLGVSVRTVQSMSDRLIKQGFIRKGQTATSKEINEQFSKLLKLSA